MAGAQFRVITREQLLDAGLSQRQINHRLRVKWLRREHAGVFALGPGPLSFRGRYLAAVLACGEAAVLSHRSAADLWGVIKTTSRRIDVTIPEGGSRRRPGITIHRTRCLEAADTTILDAIPCTTWPRTLVDLAAVATERELRRALEQSMILRRFDRRALEAALVAASGRRGTGALRRLLARLDDHPAPTRSELERRFLELVREAGLSAPVVNSLQSGHEVDFRWPAQRLIVEVDGRATHATEIAFERDRARDLDLELGGWHVLRFTWRQLIEEPERVAALLKQRLRPLP